MEPGGMNEPEPAMTGRRIEPRRLRRSRPSIVALALATASVL